MTVRLKISNSAGVLIVFVLLLTSFIFSPAAHASVRSNLGQMPREIPTGSGTYADSQYISLMEGGDPGPINGNSRSYADEQNNPFVWLTLYAVNQNNRSITLNLVKRDVGEQQACANYQITYEVYTLNPQGDSIPSNPNQIGNASIVNPGVVNCSGSKVQFTVDGSNLGPSDIAGYKDSSATLHIGLIKLSIRALNGTKHSPTFKAQVDNNGGTGSNATARLGFAGEETGASNPRTAIYSSNLHNDYDYKFEFAPPCGANSGLRTLEFYDDDRGVVNGNQDINSNWVNNIPYSPAPSGSINSLTVSVFDTTSNTPVTTGRSYGGSGAGSITFNHTRGHKYEFRVNSVTGGNRIIFKFRYSSGNYYFKCSNPNTWELTNNSTIQPGIGNRAWTGSTSDTAAMNLARSNYQDARFRHTVTNIGGEDIATNNVHQSWIEYTLKRSDSNTWRNSQDSNTWRKKSSNQSHSIVDGGTLYINDDGATAYSIPRSDDLECLLKSDGTPGPSCDGADRRPKNRNEACSSNTQFNNPGIVNCSWFDPDGAGPITAAWRRTQGDIYCERVVTSNYRNNNGTLSPGPIQSNRPPDPNAGNGVCIELGWFPPPTCPDWQTTASASTENLYGHDLTDAWVDDAYTFQYSFWKSGGAASETGDMGFVYFGPNDVDAAGNIIAGHGGYSQGNRRLGNYDPSFNVGPFSANDAGQTFRSRMAYGSTASQPPNHCDANGVIDFVAAQDVYVPYYYHMIPEPVTNVNTHIQQGATASLQTAVQLPERDTDTNIPFTEGSPAVGRKHTVSHDIGYKLVAYQAVGKTAAEAESEAPTISGNCAGTVPYSWSSGCTEISGNHGIFGPTDRRSLNGSYTPAILPVGTVVCFSSAVQQPFDRPGATTNSSQWLYSAPKCSTIVKSPKVQFQGGDITSGRYREGEGGIPCASPNTSARIETTAAPGGNSYQYGSWGEYGVFSSGNVFSFGSSGAQAGNTAPAKRLTFGNTGTNLGSYAYGNKCLVNHIAKFKPDSGPALPTTVYPNEYFTDASTVGKKYFEREGNVSLETRPSDTYKAIVTLVGYSDYGEDVQEGPMKPADASVRVFLKNGQSFNATASLDSNNPSAPATKTVDFNLGINGWRGIDRVTVNFANNNGESPGWSNPDPNKRPMSDRNMYLKSVRVQWQKNGTTIVADTQTTAAGSDEMRRKTDDNSNISDPNIRCNKIDSSTPTSTSWQIANRFSDGRIAFAIDENEASSDSRGYCIGVYFDSNNLNAKDGRFNDSFPPPPLLNNQYDGFNGRDMVIHAKRSGNTCNGTSGNIYVNLDIDYKNDGYTSLSQVPRFTLLADCKIIISNNVRQVRASLVAGDAIQTCSGVAKNASTCNIPLTITGVIQSKRLLLWRTSGADLTDDAAAKVPAETFIYSTDQMLSSYIYGQGESTLRPVYQTDLAPRY